MAQGYKVLGQESPAAATEVDLYVVPALTQATASTLFVTNRDPSATTYRVSVSVGGGVTANKDYTHYDVEILGNDSLAITVGYTLDAADVVRVRSASGIVSFSLFGTEVS